jgi:hypothetical protein
MLINIEGTPEAFFKGPEPLHIFIDVVKSLSAYAELF